MSVIEDLQKITPLGRGEDRQAPVVQDQHLHPAERLEQPAIASVTASQSQRLE
jgi:hypothetical protein